MLLQKNHKAKLKGRDINDAGAKRLICAVVEQAITDLRGLIDAGRIKDGQVVASPRKRVCAGYMDLIEIKQLLQFFTRGHIDSWLDKAMIDIDPGKIRDALGLRLEA
jgi:hypothetical protein